MNHRAAVAGALALATAGAGCHSVAAKAPAAQSPTSGDTSPAGSSTTAAAVAGTGDDAERAAAIQLRLADLPSGFRSQPATKTAAEQREDDAYFDACLHVPTIEKVQTTSNEADFTRTDGFAFVNGLISVTKTQAQARQDMTGLVQPKAWKCAVAAERKFLTPPRGSRIVDPGPVHRRRAATAAGARAVGDRTTLRSRPGERPLTPEAQTAAHTALCLCRSRTERTSS